MKLAAIQARLRQLADPETAKVLQRFFKTGPGDYGEGDVFLGIKVPPLRALVRECGATTVAEMEELLQSPLHEERAFALMLLVRAFQRGAEAERRGIYRLYLKNTHRINNWDLVDASAEHIVGGWLLDLDRKPLYKLVRSRSVWERRIAVLATFHYIKRRQYGDTLDLAALLLQDKHDLMHKAVGWMLREVGKRDLETEAGFLNQHYRAMPRTMLRYAIERFPEPQRRGYLLGTI